MYVVVQHELTDPPEALARGERLKRGEGAPAGARALQFYPSQDGSAVTCLWEADSVADVQEFVELRSPTAKRRTGRLVLLRRPTDSEAGQ